MTPVRIGSLFSGIGGLELGLARGLAARGIPSVTSFQVEIDPFCQRVLERHWPHAQRFQDVCTVGAHNLPQVDILCGGFPCTDLSVAGRGAGLNGENSGLWFQYLRIIRELGPPIIAVENVAVLTVRGLGDVLGGLASCGYDAEWDCIPAASVGAPHRRDRLFLIAYAQRNRLRVKPEWRQLRPAELGHAVAAHDGTAGLVPHTDSHGQPGLPQHDGQPQAGVEVLSLADADGCAMDGDAADATRAGRRPVGSQRPDVAPGAGALGELGRRGSEGALANTPRTGLERGWQGLPSECARGWGEPPSAIRRVDDGVPARLDGPRQRRRKNPDDPTYVASHTRRSGLRPVNDHKRLHAGGNAVVPAVAEVVGLRIAEMLMDGV